MLNKNKKRLRLKKSKKRLRLNKSKKRLILNKSKKRLRLNKSKIGGAYLKKAKEAVGKEYALVKIKKNKKKNKIIKQLDYYNEPKACNNRIIDIKKEKKELKNLKEKLNNIRIKLRNCDMTQKIILNTEEKNTMTAIRKNCFEFTTKKDYYNNVTMFNEIDTYIDHIIRINKLEEKELIFDINNNKEEIKGKFFIEKDTSEDNNDPLFVYDIFTRGEDSYIDYPLPEDFEDSSIGILYKENRVLLYNNHFTNIEYGLKKKPIDQDTQDIIKILGNIKDRLQEKKEIFKISNSKKKEEIIVNLEQISDKHLNSLSKLMFHYININTVKRAKVIFNHLSDTFNFNRSDMNNLTIKFFISTNLGLKDILNKKKQFIWIQIESENDPKTNIKPANTYLYSIYDCGANPTIKDLKKSNAELKKAIKKPYKFSRSSKPKPKSLTTKKKIGEKCKEKSDCNSNYCKTYSFMTKKCAEHDYYPKNNHLNTLYNTDWKQEIEKTTEAGKKAAEAAKEKREMKNYSIDIHYVKKTINERRGILFFKKDKEKEIHEYNVEGEDLIDTNSNSNFEPIHVCKSINMQNKITGDKDITFSDCLKKIFSDLLTRYKKHISDKNIEFIYNKCPVDNCINLPDKHNILCSTHYFNQKLKENNIDNLESLISLNPLIDKISYYSYEIFKDQLNIFNNFFLIEFINNVKLNKQFTICKGYPILSKILSKINEKNDYKCDKTKFPNDPLCEECKQKKNDIYNFYFNKLEVINANYQLEQLKIKNLEINYDLSTEIYTIRFDTVDDNIKFELNAKYDKGLWITNDIFNQYTNFEIVIINNILLETINEKDRSKTILEIANDSNLTNIFINKNIVEEAAVEEAAAAAAARKLRDIRSKANQPSIRALIINNINNEESSSNESSSNGSSSNGSSSNERPSPVLTIDLDLDSLEVSTDTFTLEEPLNVLEI